VAKRFQAEGLQRFSSSETGHRQMAASLAQAHRELNQWVAEELLGASTGTTEREQALRAMGRAAEWLQILLSEGAIVRLEENLIQERARRQRAEGESGSLVEIRRSEHPLRAIIDATPGWIFRKDQEHRFRLVNRSHAKAFTAPPRSLWAGTTWRWVGGKSWSGVTPRRAFEASGPMTAR
jgi:PAS domain-containing protein